MKAKTFDTLAVLPEELKNKHLTRLFSSVKIQEANVYNDSCCWIWVGHKNQGGYGRVMLSKIRYLSHRAFYQLLVGPIPEGFELDHLCRVRYCCNPEHLEPVTSRENKLRGDGLSARNAKKTACGVCGGLYSRGGNRERYCKACKSRRNRQYAARYKMRLKLKRHSRKVFHEIPLLVCMPTPCPLMT